MVPSTEDQCGAHIEDMRAAFVPGEIYTENGMNILMNFTTNFLTC
jgi:hypothetical protein